jgi:hypothetical protein
MRDRLQRRVERVERHQRERVEQRGARERRREGVRNLQRAQQEGLVEKVLCDKRRAAVPAKGPSLCVDLGGWGRYA